MLIQVIRTAASAIDLMASPNEFSGAHTLTRNMAEFQTLLPQNGDISNPGSDYEPLMNGSTDTRNSTGFSIEGPWPQSGMMDSLAPGMPWA